MQLLSVGRLIPKKGYATAMEALGALQDFDWEWTLVGEGEERESLGLLAQEKGIADRVHFVGFVENPRPFYESADFFLMPSRWEGFGLVAAEAMASGVPVLASDVPGLAEIVGRNGRGGGWLIPPESPHEWRRVLSRLLSDPGNVWIPPGRCRERAKQFGIDKTAAAYRCLYESVLAGTGKV
jgi:glycosyltransferase involved in cell wall biosynthesis